VSRRASSLWAGLTRATAMAAGRGGGLCYTPRSGASTTAGGLQQPSPQKAVHACSAPAPACLIWHQLGPRWQGTGQGLGATQFPAPPCPTLSHRRAGTLERSQPGQWSLWRVRLWWKVWARWPVASKESKLCSRQASSVAFAMRHCCVVVVCPKRLLVIPPPCLFKTRPNPSRRRHHSEQQEGCQCLPSQAGKRQQ
jgi:hypothetical protein